jgi:cystathionine beta-lyase family protein involved in aluminum resistance
MERCDVLNQISGEWETIANMVQANSQRVIQAFADGGASQVDWSGSTGYGYDDRGRDILDSVYAQVFQAERALVRPQWVSGTHVLATALRAMLGPDDVLWIVDGKLYDTLSPLVGTEHRQSLGRLGVRVQRADFDDQAQTFSATAGSVLSPPQVVFIQRTRGYSVEDPASRERVTHIIEAAHRLGAFVLVDNCYGEFTECSEPTAWGADLIAGSLLKNPGGGLAPTGGYVAGRRDLVEQVSDVLIAPNLGGEVGPTGPYLRLFGQGFFLAPLLVGEALMGQTYARALWHAAGFPTSPAVSAIHDMITAIRLDAPERVERFCRAVQSLGPLDGRARPEAWDMPGYQDPVIMAQGGMIAGGSLELSCDAPMRSPYWVYLQGGLSRWHTVMAAEYALNAVGGVSIDVRGR